MTTLTGGDLFEYLNHLETEVTKRQTQHENNTFTHTIHGFMGHILHAEQEYLTHLNPNRDNAMLSFSGCGLPSIESFNADLDTMLKNDSTTFINSKYQKMNEKSQGVDLNAFHEKVSENEFETVLKTYDTQKLNKEYSFEITDAESGEFNLFFREDSYLKAIDDFSKDNPVLVRLGNVSYDVKWNKLFVKNENSFYIPLEDKIENSTLPVIVKPTNLFNNIKYGYKLKSKHLEKIEVPGFFRNKKQIPTDYHSLIGAGYDARLNITKRLIKVLSEQFQDDICLTNRYNQKSTPIEKSVILTDHITREDLPYRSGQENHTYIIKTKSKGKFKTIGSITHNYPCYYIKDGMKHHYGSININIEKEAIADKEMNLKLLLNLKPRKIMRRLLK